MTSTREFGVSNMLEEQLTEFKRENDRAASVGTRARIDATF